MITNIGWSGHLPLTSLRERGGINLNCGAVAQWESACFASRKSRVRIPSAPPLFLRRVDVDPVMASVIVITMFIDVFGFLLYLSIANAMISLIVMAGYSADRMQQYNLANLVPLCISHSGNQRTRRHERFDCEILRLANFILFARHDS